MGNDLCIWKFKSNCILVYVPQLASLTFYVYHRYFQCTQKHGLFAPVHKVTKVRGKPPSRPDTLNTSREIRSSSTSSISSIGSSTASSLSRSMNLSSVDPGSPRSVEAKKFGSTQVWRGGMHGYGDRSIKI